MSLTGKRLKSLRDKHEEQESLTNEEIKKETKRLKKETVEEPSKKSRSKKSKKK